MGALRPGIFRFGYEGGGPYLCMAISHGGGTLWEFCGDKAQLKLHKELHKCLNSSPALSQNKITVALCKKEMLCCVKQSRMKHSQVLWASRERFAAHRTDRLVFSPSAASRTLYPDTTTRRELLMLQCHHNWHKQQVTQAHLIIQVPVYRELRFDLPFEEGVVQLLVVDVDLPHLGPNFLPHFGLHGFGVFLQEYRDVSETDSSGKYINPER